VGLTDPYLSDAPHHQMRDNDSVFVRLWRAFVVLVKLQYAWRL